MSEDRSITVARKIIALSRDDLRRKGAATIANGMTRQEVIAIAGPPDEEFGARMIWQVGISGADRLYFAVELDGEQRVERAYRPIP